MTLEYKCVGAPERPKRTRGAKSRSDRVAVAMQEIIAAEAVDGWEYLRTDLVPVEEKSGLFSRVHEVHRAVLIFRRDRHSAQSQPAQIPAVETPQISAQALQAQPQPQLSAQTEATATPGDAKFQLTAESDDVSAPPEPAPRAMRTPSGLG